MMRCHQLEGLGRLLERTDDPMEGVAVSSLLEEELSNLLNGVSRVDDRVTLGAKVLEDLVVVTSRHGLISEEVDLRELGDVLQAVGLVPTDGENVDTDLASNGELESELTAELLIHSLNHLLADLVLVVVLEELDALLLSAVTANRAQVQHTSAELDEGSSFPSQAKVRC